MLASSAPSSPTDCLLPRIANGDTDALRACITSHSGLVRSIARRLTPRADVDDALQEVFVDVWRSAARYDGRVSERSFIAMLARRRVIDRLRRYRRRPLTTPLEGTAPTPSPDSDAAESLTEAALAARHFDHLSAKQRSVLLLSTMNGMSHREIATLLDMPLGTVKAHARRGLDQLRRALAAGTSDTPRGVQIANM